MVRKANEPKKDIVEFTRNLKAEAQEFFLKPGMLNVIHCDKALLWLPVCKDLSEVRILFTEPGHFHIKPMADFKIDLGMKKFTQIETKPGESGFDCQPKFVFIARKESWMMLTPGNVIVPDEELSPKEENSDNNTIEFECP